MLYVNYKEITKVMNQILEIKFGSHLYGTSTPKSDLDLKGIYIPSAREICLGTYKKVFRTERAKAQKERNTNEDVDVEVFSLDRFVTDLMDGQSWALDMFFAPNESYTSITPTGIQVLIELRLNQEKLLTKNINTFVGYARKQAAKYGIKGSRMDALKQVMEVLNGLPGYSRLDELDHLLALRRLVDRSRDLISLEKTPLIDLVDLPQVSGIPLAHLQVCGRKVAVSSKVQHARSIFQKILSEYGERAYKAHLDGGVDWKALSHAVRVNTQALELMKTGKITFPRPDRSLLIEIKTGQLSYPTVASLIEEGLADLEEASKVSTLREVPDAEWANDFVYRIYRGVVQA